MERRMRLRHNVAEIEARDAADSGRRLLAQPEEGGKAAQPAQADAVQAGGTDADVSAPSGSARTLHLSPRSPPSPQDSTADSVPRAHATVQERTHDPSAASSPTLRELSQLRMERERVELERRGVSLAEAAGHEPGIPGAAMREGGQGPIADKAKEGVQAAIPAARRRGASPAGSSSTPTSAPALAHPPSTPDPQLGPRSALSPAPGTAPHSSSPSQLAPEPPGAPSTAPCEFARAHAELHKSPLAGYAPAPVDAAGAAQAGRPAADAVKDSTREPGTKMRSGQGPLYGDKAGAWDEAKARRARGE